MLRRLNLFSSSLPNRKVDIYAPEKKIVELAPTKSAPIAPISRVEQELLHFLARLSSPILKTTNLNTTMQEVKAALFAKDYAKAFGGKEEYREAYAARWVPSRALVYRKICRESPEIKKALTGSVEGEVRRAICLGGGAGSEVVAIGSLLSKEGAKWKGRGKVEIVAVDNCDWSAVLAKQEEAMLAEWGLRDHFNVVFQTADVLSDVPLPSTSPSTSILPATSTPIDYGNAALVTLLFTVSELFLQSRVKTMALLHHISSLAQPDTLLLVVESASLAEIPIGNSGRTYPLGMMLDHALAEDKAGGKGKAQWEKLRGEESTWYRMPEGAAHAYPLKLENTRVVIRLYRKL